MDAALDLDEARRRWPLVLGLCLLVGTAGGVGAAFDPHAKISLIEELGLHWAHWAGWAVLFPLFHAAVRRFPLDPGHRGRSIGAYVAFGPIAIATHAALHLFIASRFTSRFTSLPESSSAALYDSAKLFMDEFVRFPVGYRVLGYSFGLAVALGLEYHRRATDAAREAAALEVQLAQARFDALKAQLHPHFLFNTLNSISALLHRDAAAADRMLARLGEFLRLTLDSGAAVEVPLEEELRFARCYLGIQEVRFSDRLTTDIAVAPEVARALVPHLILQPLVENAVRHGIQPLVGAGRIAIRAERTSHGVRLEVRDNGPGTGPSGAVAGLGLANTVARLQALYGEEYRFEAKGTSGEGFRVTVEMPYRHAGEAAACAS